MRRLWLSTGGAARERRLHVAQQGVVVRAAARDRGRVVQRVADADDQRIEAPPALARDQHRVRPCARQLRTQLDQVVERRYGRAVGAVEQVDLVQQRQAWLLPYPELAQRLLDRLGLVGRVRVRYVDH